MNKIWRMLLKAYYVFLHGNIENARRLGVRVGRDCRIYITDFGSEPFLISIGDRVTITSGVRLVTHDGSTILVRNENGVRYQHYARIEIGSDVFVGLNSIVLPGVCIGSNVVVAAGSVVNKDVPDNCVVAGVPAKIIGTFEDYRRKVRENYPDEDILRTYGSYKEKVYAAIQYEDSQSLNI